MCSVSQTSILDNLVKISTLIIAIVNVFLLVKFTIDKNEKEDVVIEHDRKIQWLKTLILDHNLNHFYLFFENLENNLNALKTSCLSEDDKAKIEKQVQSDFIRLRRKFTDTLNAIDTNLYYSIINLSDNLQEEIIQTIFDKGINLAFEPKFDELILSKLTNSQTNMLKIMFQYRG